MGRAPETRRGPQERADPAVTVDDLLAIMVDQITTSAAFDLRAGAIVLAEFGAPPADPFSI
uniref:hypothetical protein n=1 Tax=Nocardia abscessus TaxID=120957 RepID=UPI003CC7FA17